MRDIKHITDKEKSRKRTQNSFRQLLTEKPGKPVGRQLLLPVFVLLLIVYAASALLFPPRHASSKKTSVTPAPYLAALDPFQSFQLSVNSLRAAQVAGSQLQAPISDGGTITYAIDVELQDRVKNVMAKYELPYAAFVAIEPKTGRVLALAGHSTMQSGWDEGSCFGLYPMASLFKIITATAALEQNKISPDTVFAYNGKTTSVNPRLWSVRPGRKNQEMSLTTAMGKSVNPVFGRLASDVAGKDSIMECVDRFGFNQALLPGTCVVPSKAEPPQDDLELKLMGAGLGREVKISPFHAAVMMAAIANEGVMMMPSLAEQIKNGKGETIFLQKPQAARRMVSQPIAAHLARMLSTTVSTGTSRKAFHDRRGRPMLASVKIAAKTGSIDGNDPVGQYSWFAAYAPINDPQIALVALVINQPKWKIKASYVGEQALESFFK